MTGVLATARLLTCIAAASWAGVAHADMPPLCSFAPGDAEFGLYESYTPYELGLGLVEFTTTTAGSHGRHQITVLQHCATGRQLSVIIRDYARNPALVAAVMELDSDMRRDTATFTLEQMRNAFNEIGAEATVSELRQQSCACATHGMALE